MWLFLFYPKKKIFISVVIRSVWLGCDDLSPPLGFSIDMSFFRTVPLMRFEMELLRDGWSLDDSGMAGRGLRIFRDALTRLKRDANHAVDLPYGFEKFIDNIAFDLDKIESAPEDLLTMDYMRSIRD